MEFFPSRTLRSHIRWLLVHQGLQKQHALTSTLTFNPNTEAAVICNTIATLPYIHHISESIRRILKVRRRFHPQENPVKDPIHPNIVPRVGVV